MKKRKLILNFSLCATTDNIHLIVEDQESFEFLKTFISSKFRQRLWCYEPIFNPFFKDAASTFFNIPKEDGDLYLKYYKVLILFFYDICKNLDQLYDELLPVAKPIAILSENFNFGSTDLISSVDFIFKVSQFSIRNQFTNDALEEWLELNKQKTYEKLPLDFEIIFDLLTKVDLDCPTQPRFCKNVEFTFDKKNECIYVHKKGVSPFEEEELKPLSVNKGDLVLQNEPGFCKNIDFTFDKKGVSPFEKEEEKPTNAEKEINLEASLLTRNVETFKKTLKEIEAELEEIRKSIGIAKQYLRQMGITHSLIGNMHNGLQPHFEEVLFRCNCISKILRIKATNASDKYWDFMMEREFERRKELKRRLREKLQKGN